MDANAFIPSISAIANNMILSSVYNSADQMNDTNNDITDASQVKPLSFSGMMKTEFNNIIPALFLK